MSACLSKVPAIVDCNFDFAQYFCLSTYRFSPEFKIKTRIYWLGADALLVKLKERIHHMKETQQ